MKRLISFLLAVILCLSNMPVTPLQVLATETEEPEAPAVVSETPAETEAPVDPAEDETLPVTAPTEAATPDGSENGPAQVISADWTDPAKYEYIIGREELDTTGCVLTLTYDDGHQEVYDITPDMVTGFDNMVLGTQTLVATCAEQEFRFDVTIIPEPEVSTEPTTHSDPVAETIPDVLDVSGISDENVSGEIEGGNLSWKLTADGTLTISGEGKMADFRNERPWEDYVSQITAVVVEEGVTSVSSSAFSSCFNLKSAVIADSVTNLGSSVFSGCKLLSSITLPAGLTEVPSNIFSSCSSLVSVRIPDTVTVIRNSAFNGCSALQEATLPEGLKTIESYAFGSCSALTDIDFPEGLESIGNDAFSGCTSLTAAILPDSVKELGSWAFYSCRALKTVKLPKGITQIQNTTFSYCDALEEIVIPAGVTTIWGSAFNYCSNLKKITFAGKAPGIYENAFNGVTAEAYYPQNYASWTAEKRQNYGGTLTWKTYDNGITEEELDAKTIIASGVCGDSMGWALYANGRLEITGSGAMTEYASAEATPWAEYTEDVKSIVVEEGVQTISSHAFSGQANLEAVSLPSTLEKLPEAVFQDCTSLEEVKIPESVDAIGESAFAGCESLEKIQFEGDAPSDMAENAFQDVTAEVHIPAGNDTWTEEKQSSLGGDLSWREVVSNASICGDNLTWAFDETTGTLTISGSGAMYDFASRDDVPWLVYAEDILKAELPDTMTALGSYAFDGCINLEQLHLPEGIPAIPKFALNRCESLTDLTIPKSVKTIGDTALSECNSLTELILPEGVETVENFAFSWNTGLNSIVLPESLKTLSDGAFENCSALESVNIPESLSIINWNTFGSCSSLKQITIPKSVTEIVYAAFGGSGLETVTFEGSAPYVADHIFKPFDGVTADARYPGGDASWTKEAMQSLGGNLNWRKVVSNEDGTITGTYGDNLTWSVDADTGTLTISGTGDMLHYRDAVYTDNPMIDGYPWHLHKDKITSVVVEEGVTSLAEIAFHGLKNLSSVMLPDSLTTVGDAALAFCATLEAVEIPENVSSIGKDIFMDDAVLNQIVFTGNAPVFDPAAFSSVTATAYYPAYNSTWTPAVKQNYGGAITWLPWSETITSGAFGEALTWSFDSATEILTISGTGEMPLFANGTQPWASVRDQITKVIVEEGVTSLGTGALTDCNAVRTISLPASLTGIFENSLPVAGSLESITVAAGNTDYRTSAGVLYTNNMQALMKYPAKKTAEAYTVSANVTVIAADAFAGCSALRELTFEADAPFIDSTAFSGAQLIACYPHGNETWTSDVMQNYGGIITWSSYVENSGETSSDEIPKLRSGKDGNLSWYLDVNGTLVISGTGPMADYDAYQQPWDEISTLHTNADTKKIVIEEGITTIGDNAFWSFYNTVEVVLPGTLTRIGKNAFHGCRSLKEITIPKSVSHIEQKAFYNCTALKTITFGHTYADALTIEDYTAFGLAENESSVQTLVRVPTVSTNSGTVSAIWNMGWNKARRSVNWQSTGNVRMEKLTISPRNAEPDAFSRYYVEAGLELEFDVDYDPETANPSVLWSIKDSQYDTGEAVFVRDGVLVGTKPGRVTIEAKAAYGYCSMGMNVYITEPTAKVSGITVSIAGDHPYEAQMNIPARMIADIQPGNAKNKDVVWSVQNGTGAATITEDGILTGTASGTVTVQAMAKDGTGVVGSSQIEIVRYVENIQILINGKPNVKNIGLDESVVLSADIYPKTATNQQIIWHVENGTGAATASAYYYLSSMELTGKKTGTITLTAYSADNGNAIARTTLNVVGTRKSYPVEGGNIYYNDVTGSIVGVDYTVTHADIPSKINGTTITTIGPHAFTDLHNLENHLKRVIIPETVTYIGDHAFAYCEGLESVIFRGSALKKIGKNAFLQCTGLKQVNIVDLAAWCNVDFEGKDAAPTANGARLDINLSVQNTIVIPESVTSISAYAFYGCSSIKELVIPETCKVIGEEAFYRLSGLEKLTISNKTISVGANAFCKLLSLKHLTLPGELDTTGWFGTGEYGWQEMETLTLTGKTVAGTSGARMPGRNAKTVILEDTITKVDDRAFYQAGTIEEVICSENITQIGEYAFASMTRLRKIALPDGLKTIGAHAFSACNALTSLEIPDSVTVIGDSAFESCVKLAHLILPDNRSEGTQIGTTLVMRCNSLNRLVIPIGISEIPEYAFSDCETLTDIVFEHTSEDALTIGPKAFYTWVRSNIPTTVVVSQATGSVHPAITGYKWNLDKDRKVTYRYCGAMDQEDNLFWAIDVDGCLTISGSGSMQDYSDAAAPWMPYLEDITAVIIEKGVTSVGASAFRGAVNLTSVTLPDGIELGEHAFSGCHQMQMIDLSMNPVRLKDSHQFQYRLPDILANAETTDLRWSLACESEILPAEIDPVTGLLQAIGCGTVTVICEDLYSGVSGYLAVTVGNGVSISTGNQTNDIVSGKTLQLSAYDINTGKKNSNVTWQIIAGTEFASINSKGLVTAKTVDRAQTVTVTATPKDDGKAGVLALNILPKATGVVLCEAGSDTSIGQTGAAVQSIPLDMHQSAVMELTARVLPEGAMEQVTWKSSDARIAAVDSNGTVTLKKPGTVTISATTNDGTKKSASVKLAVTYLDAASKLTATAEVPAIGLQETFSTSMLVYGENKEVPLDPAELTFTSSNDEISAVGKHTGVIVAGSKPGTATITAAITGDPLNRKVSVKVKVIAAQTESLLLTPVTDDIAELVMLDEHGNVTQEQEKAVHYAVYLNKDDVQSGVYTFLIRPSAVNTIGETISLVKSSLKWTSTDTRVATVKTNADSTVTVTVKAKMDGACSITAVTTDYAKTESNLTIYVRDYAPRLESASLTLNPNRISGIATGLIPSYGNEILSVSLHEYDSKRKAYQEEESSRLLPAYADGNLTITNCENIKNGTLKLLLEVRCANDMIYSYPISLKVSASLPSITTKQPQKFNLHTGSLADLLITAKNTAIESIMLVQTETDSFTSVGFDAESGMLSLMLTENYRSGGKLDAKVDLQIWLEDYREPVIKTVTVSTTTANPSITIKQNTKFNLFYKDSAAMFAVSAKKLAVTDVVLNPESTASFQLLSFDPQTGMMVVGFTQDYLDGLVKLDTKADILVYLEGYNIPITRSITISTVTTKPTLSLSAASSIINTALQSERSTTFRIWNKTAEQYLTVLPENVTAAFATAVAEGDAIKLILTEEEGKTNKGGTATIVVQEENWMQPIRLTHKVTVETKLPVPVLGSSALKLNRIFYLQTAETDVKLNQNNLSIDSICFEPASTKAATLEEAQKIAFHYADGIITASISEDAPKNGTYEFRYVVTLTEGTQLPAKTFKVNVHSTVPGVKLKTTTLKLNTALQFYEEIRETAVSLTNGTGYTLTGFRTPEDLDENVEIFFDADAQMLCAKLSSDEAALRKHTVKLNPVVYHEETGQEVVLPSTVTVTVQVHKTLPSPTLKSSTLKLNRIFTAQTAQTAISLNEQLAEISHIVFVPAAKAGSAAWIQAEKILLEYNPETGSVEASVLSEEDAPKNGTYEFRYTVHLTSGEVLPTRTMKVNVHSAVPGVKLKSSTLKLNKFLGAYAAAQTDVTLTSGAGYEVADMLLPENWDNENFDLMFSEETGTIRVQLHNTDAAVKKFAVSLTPVLRHMETGQEVVMTSPVVLTVQIYSAKPGISVSAKGKLDTMAPDSTIGYTVTKLSNVDGPIDGVSLEGQDAHLFTCTLEDTGAKPMVMVGMADGAEYATNKTYKLQLVFSICGQDVPVSVSFKVSQSSLKFASVPVLKLYQFQTWPVVCNLALTAPEFAELETISISSKTDAAFLRAMGSGEMTVTMAQDNRSAQISIHVKNPGYLIYGKSYGVYLDVIPKNNASNVKPSQVKLTVTVCK